jgi:hypothetical protein
MTKSWPGRSRSRRAQAACRPALLLFVHRGQRGDLALLVKRGPDDLLHHVVADLLGLADSARNRGTVAASLFRMNVDERAFCDLAPFLAFALPPPEPRFVSGCSSS